jgi:hypothetical protein
MEFAKTPICAKEALSMNILPVFCDIDDFCQLLDPLWKRRLLISGKRQRERAGCLCLSEVMTIIVLFHASQYGNFKAYYTEHVFKHYGGAFPRLVSYHRFVELMPSALVPLCAHLQSRKGACSGTSDRRGLSLTQAGVRMGRGERAEGASTSRASASRTLRFMPDQAGRNHAGANNLCFQAEVISSAHCRASFAVREFIPRCVTSALD